MAESESEMNEKRAYWARVAVKFAAQTGQHGEAKALHEEDCFREVVGDLICDLGHLAASYGHDFEKVLRDGLEAFREECAIAECEEAEEGGSE
ncbi:hypothetical protein [Streptomyces sp. CBMA123]|uniref:hypothetical protein n=1 Tax=Streptomyces sp. CBMA123 TaxID=1896313 RepID=UPI001661A787|nr:hypothetical protein [Streptomyces sp. CBMA123]